MVSRFRLKHLIDARRTVPGLARILARIVEPVDTVSMLLLARVLPYSVGASILLWIVKSRCARRYLFSRRIRLLERALSALPIEVNSAQVITHNLAANYLRFYRLAAIARCTDQQLRHWLRITGLEVLRQSLVKGRGVIVLNTHTTQGHLVTFVLRREGYDNLLTIGRDTKKSILLGFGKGQIDPRHGVAASKETRYLQQMQNAKRLLRNGALVQIAADGGAGVSGKETEFFGRKRVFRNGFAELAIATRAEIVPALVTMQVEGVVTVEFLAPLRSDPNKKSHRDQVDDLTAQYVAVNRRIWSQHPGDLIWVQFRRFLKWPLYDGSAT